MSFFGGRQFSALSSTTNLCRSNRYCCYIRAGHLVDRLIDRSRVSSLDTVTNKSSHQHGQRMPYFRTKQSPKRGFSRVESCSLIRDHAHFVFCCWNMRGSPRRPEQTARCLSVGFVACMCFSVHPTNSGGGLVLLFSCGSCGHDGKNKTPLLSGEILRHNAPSSARCTATCPLNTRNTADFIVVRSCSNARRSSPNWILHVARNFLLARTLEIKQTIDVSHSGHVIGTFLFFFSKKLSQNRPESTLPAGRISCRVLVCLFALLYVSFRSCLSCDWSGHERGGCNASTRSCKGRIRVLPVRRRQLRGHWLRKAHHLQVGLD